MLEYNTKHVYEDTYLSILLQVQSGTKMNSINAIFFMSTKMDIELVAYSYIIDIGRYYE